MRIAYLSADYGIPVLGGKGGSVHIQQMVRALAAAGHEVTVYCTRLGDGDASRIPARIVEVGKPAAGDVVEIARGSDAPGSERLAKERGWMARARVLEATVAADHMAAPYDMIYERYALWSRAGVRLAKVLSIPAIVEVNAPLLQEAEAYRELVAKPEAAAIEAEVFARADAIVAVSDAVAAYVVDKGAQAACVAVLPNGVDPAAFHPDVAPASIPGFGDAPVIGFVGGLKPWHGLQELLAAFRFVAARHPAARLLVAGDGPMRGWIEGFLAGTGLAERAHITGWVPHEALPPLLARMTIATAPYPPLEACYFSPLKLFEYMAAGRAIVASRVGQIDAILRQGRNGILIEPGSSDALGTALCHLLDDRQLLARLGRQAHADSAGFTWADNARRVTDIAQTLCQTSLPRHSRKAAGAAE